MWAPIGWFVFENEKCIPGRRTPIGGWKAGQDKVTQACYQFVQTKVCPAKAGGTDVKALSLQKLEAWLIHCVILLGIQSVLHS